MILGVVLCSRVMGHYLLQHCGVETERRSPFDISVYPVLCLYESRVSLGSSNMPS